MLPRNLAKIQILTHRRFIAGSTSTTLASHEANSVYLCLHGTDYKGKGRCHNVCALDKHCRRCVTFCVAFSFLRVFLQPSLLHRATLAQLADASGRIVDLMNENASAKNFMSFAAAMHWFVCDFVHLWFCVWNNLAFLLHLYYFKTGL